MSDKIGEAFVEFGTDLNKMKSGLKEAENLVKDTGKKIETTSKNTKLDFNDQLANMKLKQLKQLHAALTQQMQKKIELNASDDSINKTQRAIDAVKAKMDELGKSKTNVKIDFDDRIAKMKLEELKALEKQLRLQLQQQIKLNVDYGSLKQTKDQLDRVKSAVQSIGKETPGKSFLGKIFGNISSEAREIISSFGGVIAATFTLQKAFELLGKSLEAFEAREKAILETESIIKSMGKETEYSAGGLIKMATSLREFNKYSISTNEILKGQSFLMSFKNMNSDILPRASQLMIDLSKRMGSDTTQAALTLGLALENPSESFRRLRTAGITFNDAQKKIIEKLVETGQQAKAQEIIFETLEKRLGGFARNTVTRMEAVENRFKNFGMKIKLFVGEGVADAVTGLHNLVDSLEQGGTVGASIFMNLNSKIQEVIRSVQQLERINSGAVEIAVEKAENLVKGKTTAQLSELVKSSEATIAAMKKLGGYDKNDLDQQEAKLKVYQDQLEASKIKEKDDIKKNNNDKENLIKDYYEKVKWYDVSYNTFLEGELTKRAEELKKAGLKEIQIAEWKNEELKKRHKEYADWLKTYEAEQRVMEAAKEGLSGVQAKGTETPGLHTTMFPVEGLADAKALMEKGFDDSIMKPFVDGQRAASSFAKTLTDAFASSIFQGKNLGDVFKSLLLDLGELILKATLFKGISSAFNIASGGGVLGVAGKAIGSFLGDIFGAKVSMPTSSISIPSAIAPSPTLASVRSTNSNRDVIQALNTLNTSVQSMNINLVKKEFKANVNVGLDTKGLTRAIKTTEKSLIKSGERFND